MNEYLFDLRLFASVRVKAESVKEARAILSDCLECATANMGAFPNGDPIIGEVSPDDGEPDLIEINGNAV